MTKEKTPGEKARDGLPGVTIHGLQDTKRSMKAAEWHGKQNVKVVDRPVPLVTDPEDAVLKRPAKQGTWLMIVCRYLGTMPGMKPGQVLGHEFMGTVQEVGAGVENVAVGDRVVTCFDIACGRCFHCKKARF